MTIQDVAQNFNPRSPRGGATPQRLAKLIKISHFNPRSPRGGATLICRSRANFAAGISIHAPHEGERLAGSFAAVAAAVVISIHAPHEGERPDRLLGAPVYMSISIHAPHEGERLDSRMP